MKKLLTFLIGALMLATPVLAQGVNDITSTLQNLGFGEILIWLLTFAVVYGILSHVGEKGIPKSKASRAIISIAFAFLVLLAVPGALINVLSNLATSLVLVLVGLLVFIVILEFTIGRQRGKVQYTQEGKPVYEHGPEGKSLIELHSKWIAIVLVIIALIVFIGSGGLQLLGIAGGIELSGQSLTAIIIIIIIVLAVSWIISAGEK